MLDLNTTRWSHVNTSGYSPAGRQYHASDQYKDSIITFGGEINSTHISNELLIFDLNTARWRLAAEVVGLAGHTLNVVGNSAYIFGGRENSNKISNNMYEYNFLTYTWKKVLPSYGKSPRLVGHSSVYDMN